MNPNPGLYFCGSHGQQGKTLYVPMYRSSPLLPAHPAAASSPAGRRAQAAAPRTVELGQVAPSGGDLVDLAPGLVRGDAVPRGANPDATARATSRWLKARTRRRWRSTRALGGRPATPCLTRSRTRRPRLGLSGGQIARISRRGHPQAEVCAGVRVAGRGVPAAAAEPCSCRIHRFRTAN
jgi:hypothetical protein